MAIRWRARGKQAGQDLITPPELLLPPAVTTNRRDLVGEGDCSWDDGDINPVHLSIRNSNASLVATDSWMPRALEAGPLGTSSNDVTGEATMAPALTQPYRMHSSLTSRLSSRLSSRSLSEERAVVVGYPKVGENAATPLTPWAVDDALAEGVQASKAR